MLFLVSDDLIARLLTDCGIIASLDTHNKKQCKVQPTTSTNPDGFNWLMIEIKIIESAGSSAHKRCLTWRLSSIRLSQFIGVLVSSLDK